MTNKFMKPEDFKKNLERVEAQREALFLAENNKELQELTSLVNQAMEKGLSHIRVNYRSGRVMWRMVEMLRAEGYESDMRCETDPQESSDDSIIAHHILTWEIPTDWADE